MNIYIVKRDDPVAWEGAEACVIVAPSEQEATLAAANLVGKGQWTDVYLVGTAKSTLTAIQVLLVSHHE